MSLFAVPGAPSGRSQPRDQLDQFGESACSTCWINHKANLHERVREWQKESRTPGERSDIESAISRDLSECLVRCCPNHFLRIGIGAMNQLDLNCEAGSDGSPIWPRVIVGWSRSCFQAAAPLFCEEPALGFPTRAPAARVTALFRNSS